MHLIVVRRAVLPARAAHDLLGALDGLVLWSRALWPRILRADVGVPLDLQLRAPEPVAILGIASLRLALPVLGLLLLERVDRRREVPFVVLQVEQVELFILDLLGRAPAVVLFGELIVRCRVALAVHVGRQV